MTTERTHILDRQRSTLPSHWFPALAVFTTTAVAKKTWLVVCDAVQFTTYSRGTGFCGYTDTTYKPNTRRAQISLREKRLCYNKHMCNCSFISPWSRDNHLIWYSDMYMSYRWRESFNTVNRQIRDVITTGIDMCGRRMRKGGWGDGPYIRRGAD